MAIIKSLRRRLQNIESQATSRSVSANAKDKKYLAITLYTVIFSIAAVIIVRFTQWPHNIIYVMYDNTVDNSTNTVHVNNALNAENMKRNELHLNVFEGINHSADRKNIRITSNMTFWYEHVHGAKWLVPLYNDNFNITFCHISKNTGTLFKSLFYVMYKNLTNGFDMNPHGKRTMELPKFHNPINYVYHLFNTNWKSWVVLRDPLERFLSAYLYRCIYQKKFCLGLKRRNKNHAIIINDFKQFSRYFVSKWNNINSKNIVSFDHHYLPQHKYCLLEYFVDYYDFIVYINK
eukprot:252518_1